MTKTLFNKFLFLALTLVAFASNALAQDTKQPTVSKTELQRMYTDYLTEEGYKPSIDEDGDVVFKREGRSYFISVSENDPEYFRVVLPNFWSIESEEERAKVLAAASWSNYRSKVSKVYTVKDNTWASVELFVKDPKDFKKLFARSMSALSNGAETFTKKMRDE